MPDLLAVVHRIAETVVYTHVCLFVHQNLHCVGKPHATRMIVLLFFNSPVFNRLAAGRVCVGAGFSLSRALKSNLTSPMAVRVWIEALQQDVPVLSCLHSER
ncbi:MAG: hypothetical protein RL297_2106 [Pseudomonadota bacterium]|jgi:hypothetical protein